MNKFYDEIDKALQSYEDYKPYHTRKIEWISDRICWCWKWKKITKEQMEELCDRVIKVLEGE
jgi:hypothetical protein